MEAREDLIVLVDEDNRPVGTAPKLPSHTGQTPLHRGFSVFLFNPSGQLLLQQRALKKKVWPGVWSNSCCGHPMLDESSVAAARRRLQFELGLTDVEVLEIDPTYRYRFEKDGIVENEFCPILVAMSRENPVLNPDEVEAIRWIAWKDWITETRQHPEAYSAWSVEETKILHQHPNFQKWKTDHHIP